MSKAKIFPPVLLYLAAMALPIRYSIGSVQMTGLRTVMALMFIPLIISYFRTPPQHGKATDVLLALFICWAAIAFSQTSPNHAIENTGVLMLELLGGFLVSRCFIRSADEMIATIKAIFLISAISLPLAIFESQTGVPPLIAMLNSASAINSVASVSIEPRLGLERAQVLFAHPIHYGLFSSTLTALTLVGTAGHWSVFLRVIAATCGVVASFLALSSGAFLSVVLQLFLVMWALVFPTGRKRWFVLIATCICAYVFVDTASNRSPVRVFFSYATFSAHNAYWRGIIFEWGMLNVWQNPFVGIGLNDWVRPHFMRSGSMDNFWLVIAVRYGIPGFVLCTSAYLLGLFRVIFSPVSSELQPIRRAWVICFVGLTFTLCTVHIWTSVFSYVWFLYGAGLWLINPTPQAPQAKPQRAALRFTRFRTVPT